LVARFQEPSGYGRVILCDDDREKIQQIVEEKDCTEEQRALNLVNTGIYLVSATTLKDRIPKIGSTNAQHEYYLTDIVQERGFCAHILDPSESVYVRGVNTRAELEEAIAILQTFTA
jgi:bifunctional UDP-N-acetylglucosamine pyrophosphorylase/glucosamine-1-phosphate N-acetyltransferase